MKGQQSAISNQQSAVRKIFSPLFWLLISGFWLLTPPVYAATITADSLEYLADTDTYIASGHVKIEKNGAVISADTVIFHEDTSVAEAEGKVVYEDDETIAETSRAEMNLDKKTGRLHDAVIFVKKGHYWITGEGFEKLNGDHYKAKTASFTTCDSSPESRPAWCFKGKDVDVVVSKKITAHNVTYRIKGLPVLYSPYFAAPVKSDRSTGLLVPLIGSSTEKGFRFSPSFFWAIDDNKDATLSLDYYSKRGTGIGAEYRYVAVDSTGQWYGYHLKDRKLDKEFFVLKGKQSYKGRGWEGKADINYVNDGDYYKDYEEVDAETDLRAQRFLQSTVELSLPMKQSRLSLLGQYWVDMRYAKALVPQKLPELSYSLNPVPLGPLHFSFSSAVTNFVRDEGPRGQRLDIMPVLSHSFGDKVKVFQSLGLRETAYSLDSGGKFGSSPHRETFQYLADARMRFVKQYRTVTHVIEPSVAYSFIPGTKQLPLFDAVEVFDRTSMVRFSLLNQWDSRDLRFSLKLSQPYNLAPRPGVPSLMPTRLEASLRGPFTFTLDLSHDFDRGVVETVNSTLSFKAADETTISLGERYTGKDSITQRYLWDMQSLIPDLTISSVDKVLFYTGSVNSVLSDHWAVNASAWYNAAGGGLRDSTVKVTYRQQCWSLATAFSRRPGDNRDIPTDYSLVFYIELKGLGIVKLP